MPTVTKRQLSRTSIAYIVIGVVMIAVMTIIGMSAFMQIRNIVIEGVSAYYAEDIIEASGMTFGDNLLFISSQEVSQNIRSALPFISAAQVSRIPPDTIMIKVTKSVPVATLTVSGEVYVIDIAGRVLDRARIGTPLQSDVDISALIEIRGVEIEDTSAGNNLRAAFGAEPRLQHMLDILEALESEDLLSDVSYIDISNIVNVHFGFMEIYRVILGSGASGNTDLRPTTIRHNLAGLEIYVLDVQERFHNMSGDIIFPRDSNRPEFRAD
ncbi:MAG: FtsQ-type POTRA domain-containing protein [Oscillospiraceae bacterium]|nr:FtsQ-type POTRA domain-containing protein [Oscillospiraceae bacterium]